jgi:co-chaperonin GroES (HSP10)|tara:strand:+ start:2323 stop:2781 length:459 start_codon:yes stop_codon:yes gene_type:complete
MQMTNKVEKKEVPDRVLREFGSDGIPAHVAEEETITPDNLDDHADSLPRPTGYRILILPFSQSSVTKGGIHLAKQTVDKERLATVVGYVVETGPDAYGDINKFPDGPWCKKGDWVIFGRYAGARFQIEGGDMRLLNDDEILALIDDPEAILS